MHLILSLPFQDYTAEMGFREPIRHYRSLSSKEQTNKPTEHESMSIEQRKRDIANRKASFVLSFLDV